METQKTLSELVNGALDELQRLQYSPHSIKVYKIKLYQFQEFVANLSTENIYSKKLAAKFLREKYDYPSEKYTLSVPAKIYRTLRCFWLLDEYQLYGKFYRHINTKKEKAWPSIDRDIIEAYKDFLQKSNTSQATKTLRIRHVKSFYLFFKLKEIDSIKDVTPQLISDYVISLEKYSQVYTKHLLATLRFFLRYLGNNKICSDLSFAVPKVKKALNLKIPNLWTEDEINIFISSIDRSSSVGKRNYAILLLLTQLGIRIADIASLKLENLKWERKEIAFAQHKTGKQIVYPMLDTVGWAIIDYIKFGRYKTNLDYLFIYTQAPYNKITTNSISDFIRRHLIKCGIQKKAGIVWGPHSLRHTLAKKLLLNEIPLSLLAQIMGHSSVESAHPYLRIDIEGLKECALSLEEI